VPAGEHTYHFTELYDPSLALNAGRPPIGNALDAGRAHLVMITGANQGGKSTLLRALGLAQLMMHAGLFVAAQAFTADVSRGTFTHFKREEDVAMKSGKLDEELHRMSELADALAPGALVLFNESFASTNEREGSETARQVVAALIERRIKVVFVTHLYDFARSMFERRLDGAVYLRAERGTGGTRTFKLVPGEPLTTSFGADLYQAVFGDT
jgi:DNA mismatch repair ATPase MutS